MTWIVAEPARVVEMLEAIKLLMDLEHFVVVVGVDSRWLFRCLEIRFRELLAADGADDSDGPAATPQNYLEKIFQFSLMLPPITKEEFDHLVMTLLVADGSGTGESEPTGPAAVRSAAEMLPREPSKAIPTESSPPSSEDTPRDLLLQNEEIETIRGLGRLIRTPRSVKRLTNVYRLMRVTFGERLLLADGTCTWRYWSCSRSSSDTRARAYPS